MSPTELVQKHLPQGKTMQLATVDGGKPWICTVYYVAHGGNIYWLSWPSRRHSQEIAKQSDVAIAIPIQYDVPVIGLQIAGQASEVTDVAEVEEVLALYVAKYKKGAGFVAHFKAGTNQHNLYRCVPQSIVLFDEQHFSGEQARTELPGDALRY